MTAAWRSLALGLALLWLPACAGSPERGLWGADARALPGWERLGEAALTAATDPFTWLPAAGAAALQIGGADEDVADWANEERPLFGSRDTADDVSDGLRIGSYVLYGAAGLAAPAPEGAWLESKAKGFAVGAGTLLATRGATDGLKAVTDRERPLDQDDESFPSGHVSMTAAAARLTSDTLTYYDLSRTAEIGSDVALAGLVLTTSWARLEAGEHHPADVLAGMALGNFLAVFATEAFLAPATEDRLALGVRPEDDGMVVQLGWRF
ncbi:phosphatase PAP2 family protein [Pelagibius sp.]|uniref:phosphatase PAP2 family protein n=1 Tax=Pelagibius sp. TaxID=1931238 RepID=UPI0026278544|nr:phosphatase PAP2 family protein [Pelagibius sp.]